MAITKEQAEAWAGPGTSADEFPIPQGRFNKGRLTELLKVLLSIVECFKPSSASYLFEHNLLPVIQDDVEKFLGRQKELIKKLETKQTPKHLVLSEADEESSRRGLGAAWPPVRVSNPLYGFWHLMTCHHSVDAMHQYINQAVNIMLRGCRLDHMDLLFNRKLWFGFKNWRSATALTRGMTLLAAKRYREQSQALLARKQQQVSEQHAWLHGGYANSLTHAPALTARQARRSGVKDTELKEMWA